MAISYFFIQDVKVKTHSEKLHHSTSYGVQKPHTEAELKLGWLKSLTNIGPIQTIDTICPENTILKEKKILTKLNPIGTGILLRWSDPNNSNINQPRIIVATSRVADPDLFGQIRSRKIFTGSGSYRYFGNVKLFKQGKNILKIELLHIFRWFFSVKYNHHLNIRRNMFHVKKI